MKIETFEQTEVIGGQIEDESSPEALNLIKELGLQGQEALTTKIIKTDTIVRCPYRAMTKKELRVYETLFPDKVSINVYRESMIPLRVLQVASHAISLGIYQEIQVWCETGKPIDPILVGFIKTGEYSGDHHILARWGEALESFEVLYEKAKHQVMEDYRLKMQETDRRVKEVLNSLEGKAVEFLNGGWVIIPS